MRRTEGLRAFYSYETEAGVSVPAIQLYSSNVRMPFGIYEEAQQVRSAG